MVVDNMTWGNCIPIDYVKSSVVVLVFFIILKLGHVLIRIRAIWDTWLVKVMICQVGNIRVKRGRGEVWITICIGIIVIIIYITKMSKTKIKTSKQTNK